MSQATTPLREYETIYILRPDVTRETTEGLATRIGDVVKDGGAMQRVENWGRRKLAYAVSKHKRGIYVYMKYAGSGDIVTEVERTLNLQESVMKFQTVKLSDEAASADIKAEDVEFQHIDEPDDDHEETLAQVLGLEARSHRGSSDDTDDDESDDDDDVSDGADESDEGGEQASTADAEKEEEE